MSAAIVAENLGRDYGAARALDEVNVTIEAGATTGLVGPNGAGKTTFFSVLCGFLPPSRGRVIVLGRPPLHPDLRGRVAILPQDAALIKGVPVARQLAFFAELQGFARAPARREAARVLELVALADAAHKAPEEMSHGMLKRVGIAQAFLGAPELVLLDEPTAGLDPATAQNIRAALRAAAERTTFVVSSHNLEEIEDLCRSVVILSRGRVVEHRPVAELTARTSCLTFRLEKEPPADVDTLFRDVPAVTRVERGKPGERRLHVYFREGDGEAAQHAILQALSRAGLEFLEMSRGTSLERKVLEIAR